MKKNEFADAIDMAKDATLGMPVVTAIGNYELYVENFKSIIEYDCGILKLMTKRGTLTIFGDSLEILYYDEEEIAVKGRINKIEL